jgi:uncharacterized damage-inducible protein DinB
MTKKEIRILFDYDKWANLKLLEVIAKLNKEQYKKDLGGSFSGIHGTLVHILSADKIWMDRWNGKTPTLLRPEDFPTVETVKKLWDTYHFQMDNFLQSLSEDSLNNPVEYTDFKGNACSYPLGQQMQHKINHSTYHRGQIVMMIRQLGVNAVSTDLLIYLKQKENA